VTSTLKVGDLVQNPKALAWGRGQVRAVDGSKVHVVFENVGGRAAKVVSGAVLQRLPPEPVPLLYLLLTTRPEGKAHVFDMERVTVPELIARFERDHPLRFEDPKYLGHGGTHGTGERIYKLEAREQLLSSLLAEPGRAALARHDGPEVARMISGVLKKQNLLATQEVIALADALGDSEAAIRYASALADYVRTPRIDEAAFTAYLEAVERLPKKGVLRVVTWPIVTLLPYLAQPDRHMFLKPSVTKRAADAMGIDLLYSPEPNWKSYERLLALTGELMRVLKPLGARDHIDVQSFIWVTLSEPSAQA
jgi:hypothetical protein